MPAQSESDPVSVALHRKLVTPSVVKFRMTNLKKIGGEGESNGGGGTIALSSKVISPASQVLSTFIEYTAAVEQSYTPNSLFASLKDKYKVLSTSTSVRQSSSPIPPATNITDKNGTIQQYGGSGNGNLLMKVEVGVIAGHTSGGKTIATDNVALPLPKIVLYPANLVRLGWKGSSVPVGAGFVNLGNTCYLNSALQALLHVPAFVNWLQSDTVHVSKCESMNGLTHSECLICAMVKILHSTHKYTGSAIKPLHIYSKLKDICKHLVHGHQEDAHEFLRYLIEGMEKSYLTIFNDIRLDNYSKETTPLNQIFGGYMRTEVCCLECGHVSTTFQHFQDLLLDIRQANSVEEALETYFSRERLGDGDQAYKCGQCKRRAAATKKFSLEKPPNALCIQLKRFNAMGGKNNKHISVRLVLDMTRYIHESRPRPANSTLKYKLVSMVSHLGQSANCGHYTAIGQSAAGSYYHFDDSIVRPVPLQNVLNTNAYIIMYELVETSNKKSDHHQLVVVETNGTGPTFSSPANKHLLQLKQTTVAAASSSSNTATTIAAAATSSSTTTGALAATDRCTKLIDKSSTLKKSQQHCSSVECQNSLVPYLSESSDSESGTENISMTGDCVAATSTKRMMNKASRSAAAATVKESTSGWQVSATSIDELICRREEDNTDSGTCLASGKWSVTSQEESEELEAPRYNKGKDSRSAGSGSRLAPAVKDFSLQPSSNKTTKGKEESNGSGEQKRCRSPHPDTVKSLLDMSHQGYATTSVVTWNGNKTEINKEIEKERVQSKRPFSDYNDELDRPRVKKKRYSQQSGDSLDNGANHWNRIQDNQNKKHGWNHALNGRSRHSFYRRYAFEKSKGNGHHHHHHHSHYKTTSSSQSSNHHHHKGRRQWHWERPRPRQEQRNLLPVSSPAIHLQVIQKKPHCT